MRTARNNHPEEMSLASNRGKVNNFMHKASNRAWMVRWSNCGRSRVSSHSKPKAEIGLSECAGRDSSAVGRQ